MNYDASCPKEKLEFNFFSSPGIEWFYAVCQKVSLVKVQNLEEDAGDLWKQSLQLALESGKGQARK